MKPISISETMMYNTVRIITKSGSCGTGSYFNFKIGEFTVPVIITNKHVINYNPSEITTFLLHTKDMNGDPDGNIEITYQANWIFHDQKDLCYCYLNPILTEIERQFGKSIFYATNDFSIIPSNEQLMDLNALEELVMVGYPIGLWDARNNFPIFRKGYTASHPGIDFNEDGIGLADMACFPGSSGSPIYILNEGAYRDKRGNSYFGKSRIYLIGFLVSGPTLNANGDIVIQNIPTQQKFTTNTPVMVNLGYYIKSSELNNFVPKILQHTSIKP